MNDLPVIYVASKTKHAPMWREHRAGWEGVALVASTWIDEAAEDESADLSDLWDRCISEAANADLLIAYHEADEQWKGAYIEIGAALTSGIPVYVCGRPAGTFVNHPLVTYASDPSDALCDFLAGLAARTTNGEPT